MALYKIGVTEAGDAGVDLFWEEKLDDVDAAVLITKCVSPDFFDAALRHKDKLIMAITVSLRPKHSFRKWTICCGKQSSSGKGWITAKFSELSPVQNPVLRSRLPVDAFQTMTSICLDFLRMQNQMGLAINERAVCVMQGKLNC